MICAVPLPDSDCLTIPTYNHRLDRGGEDQRRLGEYTAQRNPLHERKRFRSSVCENGDRRADTKALPGTNKGGLGAA